uniref:Neugrin-like n=1 Tax=Saccoglossus kowalevskii TaxID=10224 RepID=A0ABM0GLY9_SACKO|nr:PREDICTED: neugrin-like [Saccoglossus kowalevskii]
MTPSSAGIMIVRQLVKLSYKQVKSAKCISSSAVYTSYERVLNDMKRRVARNEEDVKHDDPNYLGAIERESRRRQYGMIRARATQELSKGFKEVRVLSRDAMKQLRYLSQEHPDEWTVKRLAKSFDVSEIAVIRILKSKYVPNVRRARKQDEVVISNVGLLAQEKQESQKTLKSGADDEVDSLMVISKTKHHSKLKFQNNQLGTFTKIALTSVQVTEKLQQLQQKQLNESDQKLEHSDTKLNTDAVKAIKNQNKTDNMTIYDSDISEIDIRDDNDENTDEIDDPHIGDEEYDFKLSDVKFLKNAKPMKIIKSGNRFYDKEGNFLYRI